jgi:autotransporter-associated beta strand protein
MYVGNPTLGQGSVFGGGYGGGSNGNGVGGGGGAGLGGAIFVDNGGILSITDAAFVGNKAIGGAAGKGNDSKKSGTAGQGLGDDLFLLSGSTTSFASTSGTLTISNPILSDLGAAGGSLTSGGVIIGPGAGTVSFPEGNTYTGGTTIQGTLMVSTDTVQPGTGGSLGYYDPQNSPGSITFNGGTLVTTNTTAPTYFTTDRLITLNGSGTLSPSTGSNGTFNGVISGTGPLIISGGGTVFPTAQNTYTGGTVVNGSLSISSDGNLGAPTGLLTMNAGSFLLMTNNVVTNSNRQVNLANSFANFWVGSGLSSTINGQITGPGILFKDQPGNLTLTNGTNNYAGGTYVNGGSLTVTSASLPVSNGAQLSGHLIFDQGFDGTYAGTITNFLTGTGFVTKTGTGIVTLNNTNTYSGGTTIIEGGISIGSASNIGTGPIQFTGNSSLLLTAPVNLTQNLSINQNVIATIGDGGAPNTSTFSGLISGAGALNLNMTTTGRLNLANPQANTYSGGTLLQSGILGIANGNNLGTGPITFSGNSTIALMAPLQIPATAEIFINGGVTATIDDGGFSSTLNGPISDGTPAGGALQKIGTGVLTMVAPSSYTGLTTIAQGTLAFQGNGAVSSQSNILVNAGATLDISQITPQSFSASNVSGNGTIGLGNKILNMNTSTAATFAGNITDTAISGLTGGSLVVNQNGINGVYTLSGVNTYTGGTTVNGGTLAITALSAFPAGTDLAVNNGATFDITALASTLSIGNLRGNPGIINLGSNALQTNITQDSSFSSTGSGINGTPGSTLIKNGPAKLTLIGQNNYTDGTTINNGTLGIFRDDSLGLVTGNLNFNGGTLSVEDTFSTTRNYNIMGGGGTVDTPLPDTRLTVSSGILGSGILTKKGVGEMILTGNSAAFSGSVIVDEGFLTVLNNLPVAVTVNPAGILKGTGPIGNGATTLTNSGIVSPGNSIGTLAVVGDYVQTSQGHYLAEINDQGASDLISITGTATLDGALDVLPLQGAYFANSGIVYTVLDAAGGRTGTFSSFNVLDPEHTLKLTVIYTPSLVLLTSATNRFFLQTQIKKHNPKEVARYLESLQYYQNGQPIPGQEDLISVIVNLSKLPGPQLVNALDQLHPAQFGEFGLVNSDIKSLIASIVNRSPLENACTHAFELHRCGNASVWIEPFGLNINLKPRNDQRGFHAQTIGALLGADYTNSNGVVTGIAIGSNTTYLKWSGGMGHAHTPSGFLTLFSNWNNEWAYLEGSIIGGYDYFSTVRHIHFPGENRKAKSKHSGFDWGIHVGAKYKVAVGTLNCSPFVNLDCDTLYQDKFSEHGADSLNLEVQKKSFSMLRIEEGFSISRSFVTSEGRITPTAWISMVTTTPLYNRHYTSSMQGQDKSFRVWTYRSTINRLSPGIELVWSTRHGIVLSGRFSAEFGTGISTQKGDLRLEWNF